MTTRMASTYVSALVCLLYAATYPLCKASGIPESYLESVELNPVNFFVSVKVTNTPPGRVFTLVAYEGPPNDFGPAPRKVVSDCVEAVSDTVLLFDISSPLSESGRTYTAGIFFSMFGCENYIEGDPLILGPNEVFAPYPFVSNAVLSELSVETNATGKYHRLTYSTELYTDIYISPASEAPHQFFRLSGINNSITNAVIEISTNGVEWVPEPGE